MKLKYYINGWNYCRRYFMDIGRFTENELERLMNGETIVKGDNEFRIEKEEE